MNRHGRRERQVASPTPVLLEPVLSNTTPGSRDAWPKHEAAQSARGRRAASPRKENVWVPAGRAGQETHAQKEDAENKESTLFLRQPSGRGSPESLRELVGNSAQIHVVSPGKARGFPSLATLGTEKDEPASSLEALLPVFPEFRLASARRQGTPEFGAPRGSASLARPLSSSRPFLWGSRPGSRQNGRRPSTGRSFDFGSIPSSSRPESRQLPDGVSPDSGPESETELDRECARGSQRRPDTQRTADQILGRNSSDWEDAPPSESSPDDFSARPAFSTGRSRSPFSQSVLNPKRAQSALNVYPTNLNEAPTSRWHIDAENDSVFDEKLTRIASRVRRSRPATSLGLAPKARSPRELHPGMHSSEIWGSLNERARKAAAESAQEIYERRRRRRSSPEKHSERNVPKVRASSAPLFKPQTSRHRPDAAPGDGGPPRGRQASLWAFHAPADQALLKNARSAAAAWLRQDIELYRENSFQREMLQQRVDSHSEKTLQQRRQLVLETGDLLERNRSNLEQHRAEERNRRIEERARAHQERWAATVERHVTRQRREEGARDELILLLSKEEEEDRKAEEKERLRLFKIERRRWWATLVALGGRLQLLAETVRAQREVRWREQRRFAAALFIQDWFRKVRKVLKWKRQNAAARKIQRFTRDVVFAQKDRRKKRCAGLIEMFLGDLQRSQALMLAFRTFRQRVMTIQRVVGLRTLRIRAQVALVLRQWEVAEENWIKTHELVEQKAAAPAKRLTRGRGPSAASVDGARASAAPEADARRSNANADARRTNSVPEVDVRSSTSNQSADGARANAVPEPDARKPAADGRREGRRSTIPLGSAKLPLGRTSVAEKGAAKPAPKKPAVKLDPGEKHRALFDLRDGVLGPEYAASGVHVPRHIQEEVAKAFCMQKRRAHVETLKAFAAARAEQARVAREAELMARAKQMMAGKGTARGGPAETNRAVLPPRLRVLATRKELQELMVEGLAKAAIEGLVANLPGDQTPVTEPNPSSLEPERSSKRSSRETSSVRTSSGGGSRRGTREAQVAAPVKVIPGGSRRGTREVTVMAAIQEGEGEARVVPQVLNLAAQMVELGGTKRGAGRRGTNAKKVVTWDSEAAVPSAVRLAVPLAVPLTVLEEAAPQKEIA